MLLCDCYGARTLACCLVVPRPRWPIRRKAPAKPGAASGIGATRPRGRFYRLLHASVAGNPKQSSQSLLFHRGSHVRALSQNDWNPRFCALRAAKLICADDRCCATIARRFASESSPHELGQPLPAISPTPSRAASKTSQIDAIAARPQNCTSKPWPKSSF